jgi:hypothetical protein
MFSDEELMFLEIYEVFLRIEHGWREVLKGGSSSDIPCSGRAGSLVCVF